MQSGRYRIARHPEPPCPHILFGRGLFGRGPSAGPRDCLYPGNQWGPDAFFRSIDGDVRLPGPTGDPSARLGGTENRPMWMILLFAVLGLTAVGLSVMSYVKRRRLARRVELVRQ